MLNSDLSNHVLIVITYTYNRYSNLISKIKKKLIISDEKNLFYSFFNFFMKNDCLYV